MSESSERKIGPWGWFAVVVLLGFLVAAIAYAVHAWNALDGVGISPLGWTFLVFGVVFTILVGGGLMALLFYSSRHHYDQ
jgi:prolipoprotein diacylglyceryltransferase